MEIATPVEVTGLLTHHQSSENDPKVEVANDVDPIRNPDNNQVTYISSNNDNVLWINYFIQLFLVVVGCILITRNTDQAPCILFGIIVVLIAYESFAGNHGGAGYFSLSLLIFPYHLPYRNEAAWLPAAASALAIFASQAITLLDKLMEMKKSFSSKWPAIINNNDHRFLYITLLAERRKKNNMWSSKYPLATVPLSYAMTLMALLVVISLLLWTGAKVWMNWIIVALMLPTTGILSLLFVQVALLLLLADGERQRRFWRSRIFDLFFHDPNTNDRINHKMLLPKLLYVVLKLASMACLLAAVTTSWAVVLPIAVYAGFFFTSLGFSISSSAIPLERDDFSVHMNQDDDFFAKGYFAPSLTTRRQLTWSLIRLLAVAVAAFLPVIVGFLYYLSVDDDVQGHVSASPSEQKQVKDGSANLCGLLVVATWASILIVVMSYYAIRSKPLAWRIHKTQHQAMVNLVVDTVGGTTNCHYRVCRAYKNNNNNKEINPPISSHDLIMGKYLTNSMVNRIVMVETKAESFDGPTTIVHQLTPEDPDAFVEMITKAVEQCTL